MQDLEAYANLLLRAGVNLQPGQDLSLGAEPVHWDFVNLLAEQAYRMGARYVHCNVVHPGFGRARLDHAPDATLDHVPPHQVTRLEQFVRDETCSLYIGGSEHPALLENVDPQRQRITQSAQREAFKAYREATSSSRIAWCYAELPTRAWANQVLGVPDPNALWDLLRPILRLDRDDPVAAWREHAESLIGRADTLDRAELRRLHFQSPGTDLEVHLLPAGQWIGGSAVVPSGTRFMPNLPTEEVFTSPDYRHTSGRARVTRPVEVLGQEVHGAWFEFREGEVVEFGADSGHERLESYFAIDPRARRLGEVALVDSRSPIFESGRIFHSILYDENAACHIALGSGYAETFAGGPDLSEEERLAAGLNQSLLHTDFMIGSDQLQVTGYDASGAAVPVMVDGRFVTAFEA